MTRIVAGEILRKQIDSTWYLAQNTLFGWTITSSPDQASGGTHLAFHAIDAGSQSSSAQLEQLERSIQRFWQIENIQPKSMLTRDEQLAEDIFAATHRRDPATGRYIVNIPFRENVPALGDSRQTALKRFHALEARMARNPDLARECHAFMEDYLSTGHMIPAPPQPPDPSSAYHIPFHAIFKKKFRLVYDASCATTTGVSLNDRQLSGPKLQDDLCEILLRFRMHRYAVSADIVKMFRQVRVHQDHWDYRRILWRPSPDQPVKEYLITVVVWGMASATFNAVRALRQCANDQKAIFPVASRAAMEDFYVDDFLSGTDDEGSLITLHQQLSQMCSNLAVLHWPNGAPTTQGWLPKSDSARAPKYKSTTKLVC